MRQTGIIHVNSIQIDRASCVINFNKACILSSSKRMQLDFLFEYLTVHIYTVIPNTTVVTQLLL